MARSRILSTVANLSNITKLSTKQLAVIRKKVSLFNSIKKAESRLGRRSLRRNELTDLVSEESGLGRLVKKHRSGLRKANRTNLRKNRQVSFGGPIAGDVPFVVLRSKKRSGSFKSFSRNIGR